MSDGGEGAQRLFVAVELTDDVRYGLAAHLETATAGRGLPGRVVRPPNWHLTLRFIGWADPVGHDRLLAGLDTADLGDPFTMGFGGLGAFPRPARATVLWMAITDGATELASVAAVCEEVCVGAGFAPEDRPFAAHLTLSRIRPWQDVAPLLERVAAFPGRQRVDSVVVYRSHLRPAGAEYEVVERFPLG